MIKAIPGRTYEGPWTCSADGKVLTQQRMIVTSPNYWLPDDWHEVPVTPHTVPPPPPTEDEYRR